MPRGSRKKPDFQKAGELPRAGEVSAGGDDLSPTDKGKDFVKAGETA